MSATISPSLDPRSTVGHLVAERPDRARMFETLEIDYCCGGKLSLAAACQKRGLDVLLVVRLLQDADAQAQHACANLIDADALGLSDLADHIEQTHHAYLRRELPRLDELTAKVLRAHGNADPRLGEVREAFCALRDELGSHMLKEERVLFPMIRAMEGASTAPEFHCGSIANPIRQMESEHESAGDALAIMRRATDGYRPPEWACNTYRAMLDSLARLERDMHQHVHKENNVLFPKALKLESKLTGAPEA